MAGADGKLYVSDYGYFNQALNAEVRKERLEKAVRHIQRALEIGHCKPFDTIAIRGMSGAVFGAPLAHLLNANLVVVRKPEDGRSHSMSDIEGLQYCKRYIIVDDFVASGATVRAIHDTMELAGRQNSRYQTQCVGIFTFTTSEHGCFENMRALIGAQDNGSGSIDVGVERSETQAGEENGTAACDSPGI